MPQALDLTGKIFGYWTVLEKTEERRHGNVMWKCRCRCGKIQLVAASALKSGHSKSCGCLSKEHKPFQNLIGMHFGKLTVIDFIGYRNNCGPYWKCRCECGRCSEVTSYNLLNDKSKSCGCCNTKQANKKATHNLLGKKFNRLTVIEDAGKGTNDGHLWKCKCDCGNIIIVGAHSLTIGHTKSCGCLAKEHSKKLGHSNKNDLTGQRFGKLVVLKDSGKRSYLKNGQSTDVIWKCKCDCGNITYVHTAHLKSGDTISCGCFTSSRGEEKIKSILEDNNIAYVSQKRFQDCKDERTLPFDFFLPDYNCCIEYDGEQHYRRTNFFGGEEAFLSRIKHDKIKNQYCKKNNIVLVRIPYWDYKKISCDYLLERIKNAS